MISLVGPRPPAAQAHGAIRAPNSSRPTPSQKQPMAARLALSVSPWSTSCPGSGPVMYPVPAPNPPEPNGCPTVDAGPNLAPPPPPPYGTTISLGGITGTVGVDAHIGLCRAD